MADRGRDPIDESADSSGQAELPLTPAPGSAMCDRLRAEIGTGYAVAAKVRKKHPKDAVKQAALFWYVFDPVALTGTLRKAGKRSKKAYQARTVRAIKLCRANGFQIDNIDQFRHKHAVFVLQAIEAQPPQKGKDKASELTNYWTVLRRLLNSFDRARQFPELKHLLKDPANAKRRLVAVEDKSFTGNNVIPEVAIEHARAYGDIPAWRLWAMREYGMRLKEASFMGLDSICDGGRYIKYLNLYAGTKGGKQRVVEIREVKSESQLACLEEFRRLLAKHPSRDGKLWEKGKKHTWKAVRDRMNYIAKKIGLTKAQLGVTMHGLRHEFCQEFYEESTGHAPPIRGGSLTHKEDLAARKAISLATGHHRPDITGAYNGTKNVVDAHKEAVKNRIFARFQTSEVYQVLRASGIDRVVLVGAAAQNLLVREKALVAWEGTPGAEQAPEVIALFGKFFKHGCHFVSIDWADRDVELTIFDREAQWGPV